MHTIQGGSHQNYSFRLYHNLKTKQMVAIKNKQEVQTLLSSRKSGGVKKPILFITEINSLKKGEGLFIPTKDWKLQTKPSSYYYSKVTKSEETKSIKVSKVEGGYLITKL